jgi:YrbI family 3-deoxy-D-manno-octulosonate 8-phosphate phosphatase
MSLSVVAIIPARGGSKGIPRKNLIPLSGKPLIVYTIENALNSKYIEIVVVSTDDQEIAQISRKVGADVVMRPAEISGGTASSESAILHTLDTLEKENSFKPELVAFLQCTAPLTLPQDIDGSIEALLEERADTALSVTPFHYFLWGRNENNEVVGINHDKTIRQLRQERTPQYLETGAVYVMRRKGFIHTGHRFFGKTAFYVMPPERCLEIDEPIDIVLAETILRQREHKQALSSLPPTISALILDFDGVFTDNRVLVFGDGAEAVLCDRGDGMGLSRIKERGIPILVLSSEPNSVVLARARKLELECLYGLENKQIALAKWLNKHHLDAEHAIYVGNDVNDLTCMEYVGFPVAVADAHPEVIRRAKLILESSGGSGAIREICELIIEK